MNRILTVTLSALLCLSLGVTSGCNKPAALNVALDDTDNRELLKLLSHYDLAIQNKQFELGHDYLLAMMRLSPGANEVFNRSLQFVKRTQADENIEVNLLGEIIFSRIELLIPFQPANRISATYGKGMSARNHGLPWST